MPDRQRGFLAGLAEHWYAWLMVVGLAMLVAASVLLGATLTGVIGGREQPGLAEFDPGGSVTPIASAEAGRSDATTSTGFDVGDEVERLRRPPPAPGSTGEPAPEPAFIPIERLVIASIGVDAPVVVLGVDPDGVMQSPGGPEQVGWYNFSGRPGSGGNAVISGHVDYHNYGPAVFWELRDLGRGDIVQVRLVDGTSYSYVVVSANAYDADDAPIEEIIGPTPRESVTLITCAGSFDRSIRQYSHRLVVRAERL